MSTFPSERTQEFAELLYLFFISEKGYRVDDAALELGISSSTMYEYIRGKRIFPPDLIAPLYRATGERRFLSFFLDACNIAFHELPCSKEGWSNKDLLQEAILAQEECLDVLKAIMTSLRDDGRIDLRELELIKKEYFEAQGALAKLLACAKASSNVKTA